MVRFAGYLEWARYFKMTTNERALLRQTREAFVPVDATLGDPPADRPITDSDLDNAVAAWDAADPAGMAGALNATPVDE